MYTIERANQFIADQQTTIDPTFRQQFHLQPPIGWMNDPNGFVALADGIHVFYQFYPYQSKWGPMHWGHAKTTDGSHWQQLPVALAPDQVYDQKGCFSGTAIWDHDRLLLMYTGGREVEGEEQQIQCLAESKDLLHFEKAAANPVISAHNCPDFLSLKDFRDPKIIKRDDTYYALIVTKTMDSLGQLVLFESTDSLHWQYKSIVLTGTKELGEMWECPDLLTIAGRDVLILSAIKMPSQKDKYLNASSCLYFVGDMDWEIGKFTYETFDELDAGLDFYAPQTAKLADSTQLLIAWMQMWDRNIPTDDLDHHWVGCMTIMRSLQLVGTRLVQKPFLPPSTNSVTICLADQSEFKLTKQQKHLILRNIKDIDFQMKIGNQEEFLLLEKKGYTFSLSREHIFYTIQGSETDYQELRSWSYTEELLEDQLEILLDTSSIELFIGGGAKTMSMRFFSKNRLDTLNYSGGKSNVTLQLAEINLTNNKAGTTI